MKFLNKKQNKGFTLVEALVAVSILTLSITAAFSAAQTGLQTSNIAKNQITAFYLAQDAFEYIRNVRDTEKLANYDGGWNNFVNRFSGCGGECGIDTSSLGNSEIVTGSDATRLYNRDGIYTHNSGLNPAPDVTVFDRKVLFVPFGDDEVWVTIIVKWTQGARSMSFEAKDLLTNWQ